MFLFGLFPFIGEILQHPPFLEVFQRQLDHLSVVIRSLIAALNRKERRADTHREKCPVKKSALIPLQEIIRPAMRLPEPGSFHWGHADLWVQLGLVLDQFVQAGFGGLYVQHGRTSSAIFPFLPQSSEWSPTVPPVLLPEERSGIQQTGHS